MKLLAWTLGLLILASCSSVSRKAETKPPEQVMKDYQAKMRSIAGVGMPSYAKESTKNPHLHNVDLTLIGPEDDLILFYKNANEIVIQKCDTYKSRIPIKEKADCSPKSKPRTAWADAFKRRLKFALRVENFDTLTSDNKQKLADYREDLKQSSSTEDLIRQRDEANMKYKQLKAFVDAYGAENTKQGGLDTLDAKLKDLNVKISQGQKFSDAVVEINKLVDRVVDEVIGGSQMKTYKYSTDKGGVEYSILRAYMRPFFVDAAYVPVKAGSFIRWPTRSEKNRNSDEHLKVTLSKDFEIGATEVTQLQWVVVMGSNPSYFKEEKYCKDSYMKINDIAVCADLPVESVSWNQVQDFIAEYNKSAQDGYTYRLPTDAEWEYAARAGAQTEYAFRDGTFKLRDYAWYHENSEKQSHPVATKMANAWGIYDMYGNVWEWVDCYRKKLPDGVDQDPKCYSSDPHRVVRGHSWYESYVLYPPGTSDVDYSYVYQQEKRLYNIGFRLVRTVKQR